MGDNHSSRIWCWGKGSLRPTAEYQVETHFWMTVSVNTCSSIIIIIPWSRFWNQGPCDKRQKMTWVSTSSPFLEQEMNRCSAQWAAPPATPVLLYPPHPLPNHSGTKIPKLFQFLCTLVSQLLSVILDMRCGRSRYGRYLPEIMEVPRPQIGPH